MEYDMKFAPTLLFVAMVFAGKGILPGPYEIGDSSGEGCTNLNSRFQLIPPIYAIGIGASLAVIL